jgi:hypothetical protein
MEISEGKLQVKVRNNGNNHLLAQKIKVTGLDANGAEVFTRETSGWYVLPGIQRSFPIEIFREDCRQVSTLQATVTGSALSLTGQITVDEAATARLAGRDDKKREDAAQLPAPAVH